MFQVQDQKEKKQPEKPGSMFLTTVAASVTLGAAVVLLSGCGKSKPEQPASAASQAATAVQHQASQAYPDAAALQARISAMEQDFSPAVLMKVDAAMAHRIATLPDSPMQQQALTQMASAYSYSVSRGVMPAGKDDVEKQHLAFEQGLFMAYAYGRLVDAQSCIRMQYPDGLAQQRIAMMRDWTIVTPEQQSRMAEVDRYVASLKAEGAEIQPHGLGGCAWEQDKEWDAVQADPPVAPMVDDRLGVPAVPAPAATPQGATAAPAATGAVR